MIDGDDPRQKPLVALDRALNVLVALAAGGPLGVTELGRRLSLPKAAVFRILRTLQGRGFVHFEPRTENYTLGVALLGLADKVRSRESVADVAFPYLAELASQTGEQASVAVLKEDSALIVKEARPGRGSHLNVDLGPTAPLHCSALGKVLLAYAHPETLQRYVCGGHAVRHTKNTLVTATALEAEMARIRQRGWAVDNEELEEGLYCVAAPVFGAGGAAVAAVSLSGPSARLGKGADTLIPQVCDAALAVSSRLGWRGAPHQGVREGAVPG